MYSGHENKPDPLKFGKKPYWHPSTHEEEGAEKQKNKQIHWNGPTKVRNLIQLSQLRISRMT